MTPDILHLITARGGSKGVPRKNLQRLGGLSLIGYKARAALRSTHCTTLVLSSDDPEILAEGRRHGAETPFVRPSELASDTASSDAVVSHALDALATDGRDAFDYVMLLEPASPFATPDHLDRAVELAMERRAALVVGMGPAPVPSLFVGPLGEDGLADRIVGRFADRPSLRRQDLEPEYTMNGSLYLVEVASLRRTGRIYGEPERTYGLPMDEIHSHSIDTPLDLALAQLLVDEGHLDTTPWQ